MANVNVPKVDFPFKRCEECTLNRSSRRNVTGRGSLKAKVIFLGEAPGAQEVIEGAPFMGKAGRLFNSLLDEVGFDSESYYITNPVFCRPTDSVGSNREPTKEEMACCFDNLETVIKLINPKVVVPMGNVALERIEGKSKSKISARRGIPLPNPKNYFFISIPTFHPSFALRDPSKTGIIRSDLLYIKSYLEGKVGGVAKKDYRIVKDFDEAERLLARVDQQSAFSFDIETSGKEYWNPKLKILGIGFSASRGAGFYVPFYYRPTALGDKIRGKRIDLNEKYPLVPYWKDPKVFTAVWRLVKTVLENPETRKAAHNGKFDVLVLRSKGIEVSNFVFDTMLAHHLLDENNRHSLDSLSIRYDDLRGYKHSISPYIAKKEEDEERDYSFVPLKTLGEYCCGDCDSTFRLASDFTPELDSNPTLRNLFDTLTMPLQKVLTDMQWVGIKVDVPYVKGLITEYEEKIGVVSNVIYDLCGKEFNINSNPQLGEILFKKMKIKPIKYSEKTKEPSTDESVMVQLAKSHEVCQKILDYRGLQKIYSTYLVSILDKVDVDERIHPRFKVQGTVTGRLSSSDPNLQNIPRDSKVRQIFVAQPGWRWLGFDYSQMELRILAQYSQDPQMLKDFSGTDVDIHVNTASSIFNIPMDKIYDHPDFKRLRKIAKGVNFAVSYGSGPAGLAEKLGIPIPDAEKFMREYFIKYKGVKKWIDETHTLAFRDKQVVSIFGRIRRLPSITSAIKEERAEAQRQSVNSLVQGSAAEFCNYSTIRVGKALKEIRTKARLVNTVHDAIYVECPEGKEVDRVVPVVLENMKKPLPGITVPIEVDYTDTIRWGEEEEDGKAKGKIQKYI